ncbi:MAG: DUF1003 domain-containing protein [Fimbriimonas sp.]|nr:DUF1003 domain-containing protein [Fimbriimonas sp.]
MADESQSNKKNSLTTDTWNKLRLRRPASAGAPVKNANQVHDSQLSPLDKFAMAITDKVGSMGFFLIIFGWTVLWCGYNLLASEVPALHWPAFDPFPAFVAYLLMSNVIQILLMPLIMVGQNLQGHHSEIRAELDFETNKKAEQEVNVILKHLEHNTDLLIQLMKHLDCKITDEELRAITAEKNLAEKVEQVQIKSSGG